MYPNGLHRQTRTLVIPANIFASSFLPKTSPDPTKGEPSAIVTAVPLFPCHICPDGTFKANTGDSLALCLPCDEVTAESIDARTRLFGSLKRNAGRWSF